MLDREREIFQKFGEILLATGDEKGNPRSDIDRARRTRFIEIEMDATDISSMEFLAIALWLFEITEVPNWLQLVRQDVTQCGRDARTLLGLPREPVPMGGKEGSRN